MSELLTEKAVRARLRAATEAAGGVSAWAKPRNFSPQYVSNVVSGARPLSPRILGELGIERVVRYIDDTAEPVR